MPGRNQTGPSGQGPMTGRGLGGCRGRGSDSPFGVGRGLGRGQGGGAGGRGMGRRFRNRTQEIPVDGEMGAAERIAVLQRELEELQKKT